MARQCSGCLDLSNGTENFFLERTTLAQTSLANLVEEDFKTVRERELLDFHIKRSSAISSEKARSMI